MAFSLRRFAAGSDDEDDLAGPQSSRSGPESVGKKAVQLLRVERTIELLMTSPTVKVEGLEKKLGCSRATLYRLLASPEFAEGMEEAINVEFATRVGAALSFLIRTMEDPATPLAHRIKLAKWLFDKFDRLTRASSGGGRSPSARGGDPAAGGGLSDEQRARLEALLGKQQPQQPAEASGDRAEVADVEDEDSREGEAV